MQRDAGDRLVNESQLSQRELAREQPVRVRPHGVPGPEILDGQPNDVTVPIGQASRCVYWGQPGACMALPQPVGRQYVDMGHRQHPSPVVSMRVVENLQLTGMQPGNARFDP